MFAELGWQALGIGAALLMSWLLTGLCRSLTLKLGMLDFPGERSSHAMPTPRGGGVAIVAAFVSASWLFDALGVLPSGTFGALLLGGMPIAAIGFWDDLRSVPIHWRLLVQVLAVMATMNHGGFWDLGPVFWIGLLAWVWLVNLYNFMDGIDGLAAVEAITVSVGGAVILGFGGETRLAGWLLSLGAACAGFLVWNWPPARIFMGDVGSGFLGFLMGLLALCTSHTDAISLWSWLILLGVFISDASLTLARRFLRGERWWQAHCHHAYQHLARRLGHKNVTMLIGLINLLWLLPLAWLASRLPQWGWSLALLAYAPLIAMAWRFRAGSPFQFRNEPERG